MSLSVQKMVAPLWKWIGTLPLILLFGCGGDNFTPYPEQDGADATIIVHASSTEWDIFLDAQHLGRISWSQPYSIPSGGHVLAVQRPRPRIELNSPSQSARARRSSLRHS
jgi:hypothetical protein